VGVKPPKASGLPEQTQDLKLKEEMAFPPGKNNAELSGKTAD